VGGFAVRRGCGATNGRRRVFSGGAVVGRGGRPPPEMARDGGAYRSMALEMAWDPLEKPDPGAGEEEEEGREEEKGMAEAGNAGAGPMREMRLVGPTRIEAQ